MYFLGIFASLIGASREGTEDEGKMSKDIGCCMLYDLTWEKNGGDMQQRSPELRLLYMVSILNPEATRTPHH